MVELSTTSDETARARSVAAEIAAAVGVYGLDLYSLCSSIAAAERYYRNMYAIGLIYRPRTELASHYFQARLPQQFDDYVWIDETRAVNPLGREAREAAPETFPFGL